MGLLAYQPFKGVYALSAVGFELARFPLWLVKYALSYGRQHPEYSFRQALGVRVLFSAVYHMAQMQVATPLPLTPGAEKERFVVIKAKPEDRALFKGPMLSNEDIQPTDIGATWFPAPLSKESDLSNVVVVLHIHGGAYVISDGRTGSHGYFAKKMLKNSPASHVLSPQYRLSTLPASKTSNPFPAALQDTLTSYLYLINDLKVQPSNIILSGDSAGANNAIAFLRYLSEYGTDTGLPNPSAAWLWSPWVNVGNDTDEFIRTNPHYGSDYISYAFMRWGAAAYAGKQGRKVLDSPYVSSKGHPFKTEVPLFVNTCGAEVLYFEDVEFAEEMEKAGNNVTLDVEKVAPHDVLLIGGNLGFDKEADASAKRAGEWYRTVRK